MRMVLCGIALVAVAPTFAADPSDEAHRQAVARADRAVREAASVAAKDPRRPAFHFQAPAKWMNDPNGPIFFGGKYHMFYQLNPYGTEWGDIHWGHAVSPNLVHWEHWPVALAPSKDRGEDHCFSGCTVVADGVPTILYTSIGPKTRAEDTAVQWAATSSDGMRTWVKSPANPIMTPALNGGNTVRDWRDPFAWKDGGVWYCVIGGSLNGKGCAVLYKSRDLKAWDFVSVLAEGKERGWECPNFFKLGDKWVLTYSPHGPVRYKIGNLGSDFQFTAEREGAFDPSKTYYAPTSMVAPDGRRLMWGWARVKGDGWNGCLTLPRVLTLRPDGRLGIEPAKELEALRGTEAATEQPAAEKFDLTLPAAAESGVEVAVTVTPGKATRFALTLTGKDGTPSHPMVAWDQKAGRIAAGETAAEFQPLDGEDTISVRVFLDRSILEAFVNGREAITSPAGYDFAGCRTLAFAADAPVGVSLKAWPLKPAPAAYPAQ